MRRTDHCAKFPNMLAALSKGIVLINYPPVRGTITTNEGEEVLQTASEPVGGVESAAAPAGDDQKPNRRSSGNPLP